MSRYIDRGQGTPAERAAAHLGRARQLDRRKGATCAQAAARHRILARDILAKAARAALEKD